MILVLTNADTEILGLRAVLEGLPAGFPPVRAANPAAIEHSPRLDGVQVVLVRLLGGRRAWERPFDDLRAACIERGVPLLAFGGEMVPDAELAAASTVPADVVARAFEYLARGGLANLDHLLRFVADRLLGSAFGFAPPEDVPAWQIWGEPVLDPALPTVGVVFYRAHVLSGNTQFVDDLCAALREKGANTLPVFCYSLRPDERGAVPALEALAGHGVDAVITTVLAMGGADGDEWAAPQLAALDVPVVQAIASTRPAAEWAASDAGLTPMDAAMSVAIPEFDGRVITVPFSFKEIVDDGDELARPSSRTERFRTAPPASRAWPSASPGSARLPRPSKRVAIVLSALPDEAQPPRQCSRARHAGERDRAPARAAPVGLPGRSHPARRRRADGRAGRRLHLRQRCAQPRAARPRPGRLARPSTRNGSRPSRTGCATRSSMRGASRRAMCSATATPSLCWARPRRRARRRAAAPRVRSRSDRGVPLSRSRPPITTSPSTAGWRRVRGATRSCTPASTARSSGSRARASACRPPAAPDAALGDLPLFYPFVVNDPGEGTQAKRRAHAVIVDHLVPPLTRADAYDELARLEQLLDEHAQVQALDPSKVPAVRQKVWDLLVDAEIHRDLGRGRGAWRRRSSTTSCCTSTVTCAS